MTIDTEKQRPTGSAESCEFCGKPQHFGFCQEMRDHNAHQKAPAPRVNPRVRN